MCDNTTSNDKVKKVKEDFSDKINFLNCFIREVIGSHNCSMVVQIDCGITSHKTFTFDHTSEGIFLVIDQLILPVDIITIMLFMKSVISNTKYQINVMSLQKLNCEILDEPEITDGRHYYNVKL